MTYHLKVVSSITGKNAHSRHINVELDLNVSSFTEIEEQISEKFHKNLSDLEPVNKNEYIYNTTDENRRIHDYLIRIEEKN